MPIFEDWLRPLEEEGTAVGEGEEDNEDEEVAAAAEEVLL